ncbi:MAG: peptide chain release factor N(5)-glutamine methyltransferase [Bacillota bacterium]
MTGREALARATARLEERGVPEAGHDAASLLGQILGRPRLELPLSYSRELGPAELAAYEGLIERRATREPLQYILGTQAFLDFELMVDARVLIPRPETELLAERAIALGRAVGARRVADVGTGSGCLAIALARALPDAHVWATDASEDALTLARANAARLGAGDRLTFLRGDFLAPLTEAGVALDLLVSNPPYIPSGELPGLQEEVRDHEPRKALDGGADGLRAYRSLAAGARSVLAPGGRVALELGYGQAAAVRALLEAAGFVGIEVSPDYAGISRVMTARLSPSERLGDRGTSEARP